MIETVLFEGNQIPVVLSIPDLTTTLPFEERLKQGIAMLKAGQFAEGLALFQDALREKPGSPAIHNNIGIALGMMGRMDEALASFREAVRLFPVYVDALTNTGACLWQMQRYAEADEALQMAIARVPDAALPRKCLGVLRLQQGDYETGWREYEHRFEADRYTRLHTEIPRWNGKPCAAPLLVWGEQGLGDQIVQLSMAGDLAGEVWWMVDPRLVTLTQRSFPHIRVLPILTRGVVGAAAQVPAGSLGRYLRPSRDFEGPLKFLKADPARKIALPSAPLRIGIAWASFNNGNAKAKTAALADFAPVFDIPGAQIVDLQYGDTALERALTPIGKRLARVDIDLKADLEGVAALIASCDHVITVSNTVAHLAAALGRPTTVMVPGSVGHYWYWNSDGDFTPWYPMAVIVRQGIGEPWGDVVKRAVRELVL